MAKPKRHPKAPAGRPLNAEGIAKAVRGALASQPVLDIHTHLYPSSFGTPVANRRVKVDPAGLMLWGIDEMLTYHYLVAELLRVVPAGQPSPAAFWKMPKEDQADLIWKTLFLDRSPVSEACRGVLTTLGRLGLKPGEKSLARYRMFFASRNPDRHLADCMKLANVETITMTNDPFDDNERSRWMSGKIRRDPRFRAVLRLDPMIVAWPAAAKRMAGWGYRVSDRPDRATIQEARRFLKDWLHMLDAVYIAASLPPAFRYPSRWDNPGAAAGELILKEAILPVCAEEHLPFAAMIGSERGVNPELKGAGDMPGRGDIRSVTNLCRTFPNNRFLVTMLSRENQHELAVAARKFPNLMIFGCWWFLNNPSLIDEITTMRVEILGTSFIPQHSDARILEQLIYKWEHSREVIGPVLAAKYQALARTGWPVTAPAIERDVEGYLRRNAAGFLAGAKG
ncbi:MAG: glucuronate isomerase [Candidatus Coatesbacteria bacterium]